MTQNPTKSSHEWGISQILFPHKQKIEDLLRANINALGEKSNLRDACEYALLNGGKRFRPALVLMIAEALNNELDASQAALAIEYFHTASLIADDLPSMDDDDERRNKPSLHKAYGESTALLASYALIAAGYECIAKNSQQLSQTIPNSDRICVLAIENATFNTGLRGATGGQYLDLFPPGNSLKNLQVLIQKKTVSLFEISFVFGWLFGGGSIDLLPTVKRAAYHFGMAFQIADDIDDMEQDAKNERAINIAVLMGKQAAEKLFHEEIEKFQKLIESLDIKSPSLQQITNNLVTNIKTK